MIYLLIYVLISFMIGHLGTKTQIYKDACRENGKDPNKERLWFIIRSPFAIPIIILRIPLIVYRVIKRFREQ